MGGAATSTYKLFERMQKDGREVAYINIVGEDEPDYFHFLFGEYWGNPKGLTNVHNCVFSRPMFSPSPRHDELAGLLQDLRPDLLIGIGTGDALLMNAAAPSVPLILFARGCQQVGTLLARGTIPHFMALSARFQDGDDSPAIVHRGEYDAVVRADLIVTNSEMLRQSYAYFFPECTGKMLSDVIWLAEAIYQEALGYAHFKKPFADREIDVLFIANRWGRVEKNFALVKKLIAKNQGMRTHVVGDVDRESPGAVYHGMVTDRERLFGLMGNAKAVACPSLFDTAPGILFEASAMDCNVVASKNCGNWRLCHPLLLVSPFDFSTFRQKLALSLARKLDDNRDFFLLQPSYQNFLDTLDVF
jgi:glycosyltransferase involved in cell wall biosynthesis